MQVRAPVQGCCRDLCRLPCLEEVASGCLLFLARVRAFRDAQLMLAVLSSRCVIILFLLLFSHVCDWTCTYLM